MSTVNCELVFKRIYHAPVELVFDMWTDPMRLCKWYGPDGYSLSTETMDLQPGGSWSYTLTGADGKNYRNKVLFLELARPRKLACRYVEDGGPDPIPFGMSLHLQGERASTLLTMQLVFDSPEDLERLARTYQVVEGCQDILSRLEAQLEGQPAARVSPTRCHA